MHTSSHRQRHLQYWQKNYRTAIGRYTSGQCSFIPELLPEKAVQLDTFQTLEILSAKLGDLHAAALNPNITIPSPLKNCTNTTWLKRTNMVGINVRTIQNFWNVVKYSFTLAASQQAIHLLPIWEPGVVASLYGMSSWNINPEFFSPELARKIPHLNTVEKQLKVVINLLHALGRTVGMDVIPHTDRYSEIVLANPRYFEWLIRQDTRIIRHDTNLHEAVQAVLMRFLQIEGSAVSMDYPSTANVFFSTHFPESARLKVLFGQPWQYQKRLNRRNKMVQLLYQLGYETAPATMAPPYRGLVVDTSETAKTVDKMGRIWRDYRITKPTPMSRAFGPLTRYKLYERKNNNHDWEIDFGKPRKEVWQYISQQYYAIQAMYNFDFMRGDMSHVQMRADVTLGELGEYYDIHKSIKKYVQQSKPYFGYFAESFLAPANHMGYGDEITHLERSEAETTLGDLQSMIIGTDEFMRHFARYYHIAKTCNIVPNFTILTADKDDPRFDKFYVNANELRLFTALFLDLPTYMGLGFEQRDTHFSPAPNEHYTKLYVFQIDHGPKKTKGRYQWGKNTRLFERLTKIKLIRELLHESLDFESIEWLIQLDSTGEREVIAWQIGKYKFVANFGDEAINLPKIFQGLNFIFSNLISKNIGGLLLAFEARIYE